MFDKFATILDEKLSTPMAKLAEQRHLRAIRDGIIATLPLIIVSSMFMVIAFLPNSDMKAPYVKAQKALFSLFLVFFSMPCTNLGMDSSAIQPF